MPAPPQGVPSRRPIPGVLSNFAAYAAYGAGAAVRTGNWGGQPITPTPEYAKLAEAYGGYGERVRTADELAPALDRALRVVREGRLALLDVFTQP